MEKVLITGSSGYLGACIFQEAEKSRHVHKLEGRLENIRPESLDYDMVIHCAGALRHRKGQHRSANEEGTKKLIKGLKRPAKFIYISSKSIYGTQRKGLLSEKSIPQPDDDYGITKYASELAVIESGYPYIIIRPSTLIGLGLNNPGPAFPSIAMQQLASGNDVHLFTPDISHEYLYVWDLAKILLQMTDNPLCWNDIFNIAGPKRSLHHLFDIIEEFFSSRSFSAGKINKIQKEPVESFFLDYTKLDKIMGGIQFTPDEEIIEKTGLYFISGFFPA